MNKILLTGGAGFLGSLLSKKLISKGYAVKCLDRLYFGTDSIKNILNHKKFELIKGNINDIEKIPDIFKGVETVIHLAGLANDPTSEIDPALTHITNYESSVKIANLARKFNIPKFIFASTCSVYGKGLADMVNEESPVNPVSIYGISKAKAEKEIIGLQSDSFSPIAFRFPTLYGVSPRMRFDLAINLMVLHAHTKRKIFIWGGGDQWRPFLHVEDAADGILNVLTLPREKISGKVYNLGSTKDNFKIIDLAKIVKDTIKGVALDIIPDNPDKRSYCVNSDKVSKELEWKPKWKISEGIKELSEYIKSKHFKGADYGKYYNIKTLQEFIKTPSLKGGDATSSNFIHFCLPTIGKEEETEVLETLHSGWLTTGPKVQRLEGMFKKYLQCKYAVCVSSCTAALHLSLAALGIKKGDEVITSPVTWPATANVIIHCNAVPRFVDVEKDTLNMDVKKLEKSITKKTKAIIPVHIAGQPCRMDEIRHIARKHKLFVVEDAAHAIGAEYNGKKIGSISDFTCFSFYPIKNMTTIEGGLVTTARKDWADKIKIYSLHGVSKDAWKRYDKNFNAHPEVVYPGFKYNMSDVQAAMGIAQLNKLDDFNKKRESISKQYDSAFKEVKELLLPRSINGIGHAHHLYIIMLNLKRLSITRDQFVQALKAENIGVGIHFRSLHIQPYYRKVFSFSKNDFPNAAYLSERILSLPLYPGMSQNDVDNVIKAVLKLTAYYRK